MYAYVASLVLSQTSDIGRSRFAHNYRTGEKLKKIEPPDSSLLKIKINFHLQEVAYLKIVIYSIIKNKKVQQGQYTTRSNFKIVG